MPNKKKGKVVAVVKLGGGGGKKKKKKSQASGIRGRGDYTLKARTESLGGTLGSWVGDLAQKALMAITGMGDYTVKQNSLVSAAGSPQGPPTFAANGRHDIVVCHREFVDVVRSGTPASGVTPFTVNSYYISVLSGTFPWLQMLAANFELWQPLGIIFEFKATSAMAVASTNTALGSVILATRYNTLTPQFASQQQMEGYEYSTSTVPFTSCIHPVECAPMENVLSELYTDPGFATGDPRMSILGVLDVATIGQQAFAILGELWVSYHIRLIRPRPFGNVPSVSYCFRASASNSSALSISNLFRDLSFAVTANTTQFPEVGDPTTITPAVLPGLPADQSLEVVLGIGSIGNSLPANTIFWPRGVAGYFIVRLFLNTTGAAVSVSVTSSTFGNGAINAPGVFTISNGSDVTTPLSGSVTNCVITTGVKITPSGSGNAANALNLPFMTYSAASTLPLAGTTTQILEIIQVSS